jgi:hypothetical protein
LVGTFRFAPRASIESVARGGCVAAARVTRDERLERVVRGGVVAARFEIVREVPQRVARGVLGPLRRIGIVAALQRGLQRREDERRAEELHSMSPFVGLDAFA